MLLSDIDFAIAFRYDSVTGIPSMQKSISLEKASVLFNLGALYSQIGTRADRGRQNGINEAIKAYESAAGERKSIFDLSVIFRFENT